MRVDESDKEEQGEERWRGGQEQGDEVGMCDVEAEQERGQDKWEGGGEEVKVQWGRKRGFGT